MNENYENQNVDNVQTNQVQPVVSPEPMVMPQPVEQTTTNNSKKGKGGLILVIILLLVLAGGGVFAYFKFFRVTPYTFFQKIVETNVDEAFNYIHEDDVFEYETTINLDLNITNSQITGSNGFETVNKLIDLVNKTVSKTNIQVDRNNKKVAFKFDSTYENEKLLNGSLYAEINNNKAYLYAPDYYDKYLEIPEVDFEDIKEIFDKKYDYKTIKKSLRREIVNLIKEEDCTKEEDYYVFTISDKELANRMNGLIKNLKNDSDFVKAIGGEEKFDELFEHSDSTELFQEAKNLVFKINEKGYEITYDKSKLSGEINGETVTYKIENDGKELSSGKVTKKGNDNNGSVTFDVNIPEYGTVKYDLSFKYTKKSSIDVADTSNSKKIEELTQSEQNEIVTKLSKSKLYTIFTDMYTQTMASVQQNMTYY